MVARDDIKYIAPYPPPPSTNKKNVKNLFSLSSSSAHLISFLQTEYSRCLKMTKGPLFFPS